MHNRFKMERDMLARPPPTLEFKRAQDSEVLITVPILVKLF